MTDPGIHDLFSAYREKGWGLSTTVIGFSTVLLAWALATKGPVDYLFLCQASFAVLAIALSFLQQFYYYKGAMHLARSFVEPTREPPGGSTKPISDRWFGRADACVEAACFSLAIAALLSIGLWASRRSVTETVAYPIEKDNGGRSLALNPTTYRADPERQRVMYWLPGVDDAPTSIPNCAVRDPKNWRCTDRDGSIISMQRGLLHAVQFGALSVEYVSREEWERVKRLEAGR
jgi:hypothetical protein